VKYAAIAGLAVAALIVGALVLRSQDASEPAKKPVAAADSGEKPQDKASKPSPAEQPVAATATAEDVAKAAGERSDPGASTAGKANALPDEASAAQASDDPEIALAAKYGDANMTLYLLIRDSTGKEPPAAVLKLLDKKLAGVELPDLVAFATSELDVDMAVKMQVVQWLEAQQGILRSGNEEMGDDERNEQAAEKEQRHD